jgi:predicted RNase H-like HicB family nuclease
MSREEVAHPVKTYTAQFERDADGNWLAELVEEPRIHTWGRSLSSARANIHEAAELWFETDHFALEEHYPSWIARPLAKAIPARREAERAADEAARATIEAVRSMTGRGLSRRDVADVLGISYQRVQQLLTEAS